MILRCATRLQAGVPGGGDGAGVSADVSRTAAAGPATGQRPTARPHAVGVAEPAGPPGGWPPPVAGGATSTRPARSASCSCSAGVRRVQGVLQQTAARAGHPAGRPASGGGQPDGRGAAVRPGPRRTSPPPSSRSTSRTAPECVMPEHLAQQVDARLAVAARGARADSATASVTAWSAASSTASDIRSVRTRASAPTTFAARAGSCSVRPWASRSPARRGRLAELVVEGQRGGVAHRRGEAARCRGCRTGRRCPSRSTTVSSPTALLPSNVPTLRSTNDPSRPSRVPVTTWMPTNSARSVRRVGHQPPHVRAALDVAADGLLDLGLGELICLVQRVRAVLLHQRT